MVTEHFIPKQFPTGTPYVSQTPSQGMLSHKLVTIIREKEILVLNYFVNFLDGRAITAAFPGFFESSFNFSEIEKIVT